MNYDDIKNLGNLYTESAMGKNIDDVIEESKPSVKVQRKPETDEWVVVYRDKDGKRDENKCYYTDDKEDAEGTKVAMQKEIDDKESTVNEGLMDRVGARMGAMKDTAKAAVGNVAASAKNVASTMSGEKSTAKGTNLKYEYEKKKAERAIEFHMNKLRNQLSKFATDMVKLGVVSEKDGEAIAQQAFSAISKVKKLKSTKNLYDIEDK